MWESSALDVLTRDSNMVTIHKKWSPAKWFAHWPVSDAFVGHFSTRLQDSLKSTVECDVFGRSWDALGDSIQLCFGDSGHWKFVSDPFALVIFEKSLFICSIVILVNAWLYIELDKCIVCYTVVFVINESNGSKPTDLIAIELVLPWWVEPMSEFEFCFFFRFC